MLAFSQGFSLYFKYSVDMFGYVAENPFRYLLHFLCSFQLHVGKLSVCRAKQMMILPFRIHLKL